jgi:hypothetical protein
LARLWFARRGDHAIGNHTKDGTVRHVSEARDRQRSLPDAVGQIIVGGAFDVLPVVPPCVLDIVRDGFAQDIECRRGSLGCLCGGRTDGALTIRWKITETQAGRSHGHSI